MEGESYHWLLSVDTSSAKTTLNLANDNMTSGFDPRSLIKTVDSSDEFSAAAGEEGLIRLRDFAVSETKTRKDEARQAQVARNEARITFIKANFPRLLKESQARALAAHPDLGKADSETNKNFLADHQKLQADKSPLLDDPSWPEKLLGDTPPEIVVPQPVAENVAPTPTPVIEWTTPKPPYPYQARTAHLTGVTEVRVTTDSSGRVNSVVVVKSAGSGVLDSNSQSWAKEKWSGPPNATYTKKLEYRLQ